MNQRRPVLHGKRALEGSLDRAALAFSRRNRERKASFAVGFVRQHGLTSVLFVGVAASDGPFRCANFVENAIARHAGWVVASGLHDDDGSWADYRVCDALALPFGANEFDLVYSNAVIEHVGEEPEQRQFLAEHARVGRAWIATTPNRMFPIESHTLTVLSPDPPMILVV